MKIVTEYVLERETDHSLIYRFNGGDKSAAKIRLPKANVSGKPMNVKVTFEAEEAS